MKQVDYYIMPGLSNQVETSSLNKMQRCMRELRCVHVQVFSILPLTVKHNWKLVSDVLILIFAYHFLLRLLLKLRPGNATQCVNISKREEYDRNVVLQELGNELFLQVCPFCKSFYLQPVV